MTNFLESLLVLGGVIALSILLPRKWFGDLFVSRGSVLVASLLIPVMTFEYKFDKPSDYVSKLPPYLTVVLLVALVCVFLAGQIGFLRKLVESFAENAVIFIYISIPVSLFSVIVVAVRNLF